MSRILHLHARPGPASARPAYAPCPPFGGITCTNTSVLMSSARPCCADGRHARQARARAEAVPGPAGGPAFPGQGHEAFGFLHASIMRAGGALGRRASVWATAMSGQPCGNALLRHACANTLHACACCAASKTWWLMHRSMHQRLPLGHDVQQPTRPQLTEQRPTNSTRRCPRW